ncbi:MAG: nucleoside deaminase [Magnetococcus sp. MYC-9]
MNETPLRYLSDDRGAMLLALVAAGTAGQRDEVPVGALLRDGAGRFLGECGNNRLAARDPTGHAELHLLRQVAERVGSDRLPGTRLAVTLEPCSMCMAALAMARVATVFYEAHTLLASQGEDALRKGMVVHHYPATDVCTEDDVPDGNQPFGGSDHASRRGPVADAAFLLRIFFDKRRQICSNASSR